MEQKDGNKRKNVRAHFVRAAECLLRMETQDTLHGCYSQKTG